MLRATALAALLASACTAATPKPTCDAFALDPAFDADERATIARAADRWNAFAGREVVRLAEDGVPEECRIAKVAGVLEDDGTQANGTFYWHGRDGLMRLATVRGCADGIDDRECLEETAMHEFGHALGLRHVEPARGIMSPGIYVRDFGDVDRAECLRVGVCR